MPKKVIIPVITVFQTVIIYLIIIIPLEYLLTETFLIFKSINPSVKTAFFILIFLGVFSANQFDKDFYQINLKLWFIWPLIFIGLLLLNREYTSYYQEIIKQPRIFSISSDWAIQGKTIEINGRSFGDQESRGEVKVNDYQLEVVDWSPEYIKVETPLLPEFFEGNLYIITEDNKESNKINFSIRDPAFLDELYDQDL